MITGKGLVFSGTVDGQDFPIVVEVPEDNPRAAQFQFPTSGETPGPCLTAGEAFCFLGSDATADVKGVLTTAIKLVAKLCEDEGWEDAVVFYRRELARHAEDPTEKVATWLWLGCRMESRQDYEAAASFYREAVQLEPAHLESRYFAHNNLGYSLNQIGRYQAAELHCREAIRTDPDRYNAHKNLGVALQGQQRPLEAATCFVRAAEISPGDMRAAGHLRVLVSKHPEIALEHPDLSERMEEVYGVVWTHMSNN